MEKTRNSNNHAVVSAQPRLHQNAPEIQPYGTVNHLLPLELEEPVRLEMTEGLNQLLADAITLRDLYKKSHWQVAGATFCQLHLLFDKHYEEQVELVDSILPSGGRPEVSVDVGLSLFTGGEATRGDARSGDEFPQRFFIGIVNHKRLRRTFCPTGLEHCGLVVR